jgi:hypothetical protein
MSSAAAESAAAAVLDVLNGTGTLSPSTQNAALSLLLDVVSAPINVTGGAAQHVTSALSVLAASAVASNPEALAVVQSVLTNLASSQANSLMAALDALPAGAPPPAPAITSSENIQTLVQVDPPGGSRLTTQPLGGSATGSPSEFQPMPAGLLPGDAPIVTKFFALKFDPNGGANTTGVTRLAFSNPDGSPIPVENAETPILFKLPPVNTSSGDDQAVCSFWDTAALSYSSQARARRLAWHARARCCSSACVT